MKIEYKGFILEANREKTHQGIYRTFYSAVEQNTKMILEENNDNISIPDAIEELKEDVDNYIKDTRNDEA
jgi:hypothetical protein